MDTKDDVLRELSHFHAVIDDAERRIKSEVRIARALGASWTEIGASLRMSKQAAQQRYSN